MYLSRVKLKRNNPRVHLILNDVNEQHRDFMSTLPARLGESPRCTAGLLYRLIDSDDELIIYATTYMRPYWLALESKGYEVNEVRVRMIDDLRNSFVKGSRLAFELKAAPTKQVISRIGISGYIFPDNSDDRFDWLLRHGLRNGFTVHTAEQSNIQHVFGCRKEKVLHFVTVEYRGVLEIRDPDLFWEALCSGIGAGKPYGLGMLMVAEL